jgi:cold shock CspA family protein
MIGRVAYSNQSRRFVLITPAGKSRDHDVFASDIWFFVAGLGEPRFGQLVEFDVALDTNGKLEAVKIRTPLQPPGAGIKHLEPLAGAAPAARSRHRAAGDFPEAR